MTPVPAFINIGWPEMLMILAIVLLFFGPKRLPEVAEAMGKSIRKFKNATQDASKEVKREFDSAAQQVKQDDKPREDGQSPGPKQP